MPENNDHSCDENCQECRKLQPGQFEYECFVFGVMQGGVLIRRHIAEGMASVLIGMESRQMHPSGCLARIIATRLEDDTPDGTKGRVIAICEPVRRIPPGPYKPDMEYK